MDLRIYSYTRLTYAFSYIHVHAQFGSFVERNEHEHRRPSQWNLKMMTSYALPVENTLKFSVAPSAPAWHALKLSLKRRKYLEKFRSRLRRAVKKIIFVSPCGFTPSGKIPAGAHEHNCALVGNGRKRFMSGWGQRCKRYSLTNLARAYSRLIQLLLSQ